jgi:hypothetical protein
MKHLTLQYVELEIQWQYMRWAVNIDRLPYLVAKGRLLLLGRKLGETHNWYENCGEERSVLALPEIEVRFLGRQTPALSVYRLRVPDSRNTSTEGVRVIMQRARTHMHTRA